MAGIDLLQSYHQVRQSVADGIGVSEGMSALVRWCAERRPHDDWERLAAVDWSGDLRLLEAWLAGCLGEDPPGESVTGLWFGLFNPVVEGVPTADLYLAGDPYVVGAEWAVSPRWMAPAAGSRALAGLYAIAYEGERSLENDAEYPLALGFAALAVRALAARMDKKLLLGRARARTLEVGFDSGDSLVVATLTA